MANGGGMSGLIDFLPKNVEKVPDEPGVFLVLASGQKVIYAGVAGDTGLRESLWQIIEQQPFGVIEYFRYETASDAAAAEELCEGYIAEFKPPHNVGYGRFRNEEVKLPKQGHSIRQAVPNP